MNAETMTDLEARAVTGEMVEAAPERYPALIVFSQTGAVSEETYREAIRRTMVYCHDAYSRKRMREFGRAIEFIRAQVADQ